jgi:hypothetical protein
MLAFQERQHKYIGLTEDLRDVEWISATGFVHKFTQPFDKLAVATKVCQKKTSKWYGMPPNVIIDIWDKENKRSTDIGSLHHAKMEAKYLAMETMPLFGKNLEVIPCVWDNDGQKISWYQNVREGVYPEYLLYLKLNEKVGISGQSDVVAVCDGKVHISDFKTSKIINYENRFQNMLPPYEHIQDCNWQHYQLQLSLYLWVILQNNPELLPGNIVINHVQFEIESTDQFGFPRILMGSDGYPVVKSTTKHPVTYMPREIENGIDYLVETYGGI